MGYPSIDDRVSDLPPIEEPAKNIYEQVGIIGCLRSTLFSVRLPTLLPLAVLPYSMYAGDFLSGTLAVATSGLLFMYNYFKFQDSFSQTKAIKEFMDIQAGKKSSSEMYVILRHSATRASTVLRRTYRIPSD